MKKLFYTLLVACSLSACGDTDYAELADCQLDFGQGEYEEPFVGVLKQKPEILRKSLQFPPYSWLAPDTLVLKKELAIDFNEESIRSKSTATISLVDSSYNPIQNLQLYINNNPVSKGMFTVKADSLSKSLVISCKVHPDLGDKEAKGYIMVQGNELDLVNSKSIQQDINSIGTWNLKQTYNIPWLLWLLWTITALIIIALCFVVICFAVKGVIALISIIITRIPSPTFSRRPSYKRSYTEEQERLEENFINEKLPKNIKRLIKVILNRSNPIHKRAVALNELQQEMDRIKEQEPNKNEKIWQLLPVNIQNTLEQFWAAFKTPTNNGCWTGSKGDSTWIPDDNYVPKNREYSNLNSLTWKQIKERYNFKGLPYKDGRAMFSSIDGMLKKDVNCTTKLHTFVLKIPWEELLKEGKEDNIITLATTGNRKSLHNAAYKKFAEINGIKYEELVHEEKPRGIKQRCILTIHEEPDCQTLRLVSQEIHGNLNHLGGIAVLKAIINNCG